MAIISFGYAITFKSPFIIASSVNDPSGFDMVSILSDGVPYVPSTTFMGKLKYYITNHCSENSSFDKYNLCEGQKSGINEKYCSQTNMPEAVCPICRIFGNPGGHLRAGFNFQSARLKDPYYRFFKTISDKSPLNVYIKRTRNRIDPLLRRAMEDALFSVGLADVPVPFYGNVEELPHHASYSQEIREFDLSLIFIGMRLVSELGGGVNRGYGHCSIEPLFENWQELVKKHIEQWKQAIKSKGTV